MIWDWKDEHAWTMYMLKHSMNTNNMQTVKTWMKTIEIRVNNINLHGYAKKTRKSMSSMERTHMITGLKHDERCDAKTELLTNVKIWFIGSEEVLTISLTNIHF